MENQLNYEAIEALEVKNLENIEAITGPLVFNEELKATDSEGDLATIIRTRSNEGVEQIQYVRRNREGDLDEPVTFTIDLEPTEEGEISE